MLFPVTVFLPRCYGFGMLLLVWLANAAPLPWQQPVPPENTYDQEGNQLTRAHLDTYGKRVGTDTWTYNDRGQVLTEVETDTTGRVLHTKAYTYSADPVGRMLTRVETGADGKVLLTITRAYAPDGTLLSEVVTDEAGKVVKR